MTTAPQGSTTTLTAQFATFVGGAPVNLDPGTATLEIIRLSDNVVILGPTTAGIVNPVTGTYTYPWAVPALEPTVDHLAVWTGTVASVPVQATEVVTVTPRTAGSGGSPAVDPCQAWPVIWPVTCDVSGAGAVTGVAVSAATEVLYALSGRRFGVCSMSIRPCRSDCSRGLWTGWDSGNWWEWGRWPRPLFFNGVWYNIACGQCQSGCSCTYVSEAWLPSPVTTVTQVKVDGVVLDPSAYRVDDWRKLVRLDGKIWPLCQDLTKADTQVGTWSVNVEFGEEVPVLGQLALGELACQFVKLLTGDKSCALPKPVQSLTRQGVQMNFLDPNELFANGRIGLYLCDLFLTSENPHGLANRSKVYDVDNPRYRVAGT